MLLAGCGFRSTALPDDGSPPGDVGNDDAAGDVAADTVLPTLVDRGLVVRYFMDEADSGQLPTTLTDSAAAPLALPITYGQMTFFETDGHRGLTWPASSSSGKAEIALGSTKLATDLATSSRVTIEVVADIKGAGLAGSESRIAGMGGGNPDFALTAVDATDIRFFRPFGTVGATWVNGNTRARMILHLVFDSTQADAAQRIELYQNGIKLVKTTSSPPGQNQTVGLGSNDQLVIGNRQTSDRSIAGTIFYVAFYNQALDSAEITNNAQRLLVNDDL